MSKGDQELIVEKSDFCRCSSRTQCGGLKKMEGFMSLRCCFFNECHGEGGDDNMFGTAFGTSESEVECEENNVFMLEAGITICR